LELDFGKIKKC